VGDPGRHAALGDQLIWFALPLLGITATLVWLDRRHRADRVDGDGMPASPAPHGVALLRTVSALAVIAAIAASVQVYRVGDSGARAAWGDRVSSSGTR